VDHHNLRHVHIVYNSYIKPPTLHEHLWILGKLLTRKYTPDYENGLAECLTQYIITTCYSKMTHRFTQPYLSAPYLNSLKSVSMAEIEFRESEPKITASDKKFFLVFLPTVMGKVLLTEIPNLRAQMDLMREAGHSAEPAHLGEQRKPIHLYTKETYCRSHPPSSRPTGKAYRNRGKPSQHTRN
jgi:hypothetical protein